MGKKEAEVGKFFPISALNTFHLSLLTFHLDIYLVHCLNLLIFVIA